MTSHSGDELYSDDSGHDVPVQESDAFSPTDGYFQPSPDESHPSVAEGSRGGPRAPSHAVPHVPDVMVDDPTLSEPRSAKETEAFQGAQQDSSGPEEPLTDESVPSTQSQQLDSTVNLSQNPILEDGERIDASNSGLGSVAPDTTSVRQPQHASPPRSTAFQSSGLLLPIHVNEAPPAYSSARPVNYGTTNASVPEIHTRSSAEEERSIVSEREPLLLPQRTLTNNTLENGLNQEASKSLRWKATSRVCLCLAIFFTAILSSLVTAALILYPTAPKTESVDAEPISVSNPEPAMSWMPRPEWNCRDTPYRISDTSYEVALNRNSDINIVEEGWSNDAGSTDGTQIAVFGEIVIRSSRPGESAKVTIDGFTNDPRIRPHLNIRSGHEAQTYYLSGPPPILSWPANVGSPCYQGRIVLWLPAGSVFESTYIISESFNITIRAGLDITITEGFFSSLDKGDIIAPDVIDIGDGPIAPYKIQTPNSLFASMLGDVRGWFPQYNVLQLHSVFGDVSALIGLKPLDLLKDSSARLEVSSRRGNINVTAVPPQQDRSGHKDGKLPLRDYASVLLTRVGNITAKLAIGSRTEFETVSGHIVADLQPILSYKSREWNRNPWLNTLSEDGNTEIQVREPIWTDAIEFPNNDHPIRATSGGGGGALAQKIGSKGHQYFFSLLPVFRNWNSPITNRATIAPNEPWGNFESQHISSEGNILLTYPDSWAGTINWQGTSTKGVSLIADSVTVLRQWGTVIKHIEARRGTGRSIVNVDTQGGIAILAIGQEISKNDTDLLRFYPVKSRTGSISRRE